MGKSMKHVWAAGFGLALSAAFAQPVFAENELQDIRIEVELQEDGSGTVTEYRQMTMDDGTELYITLEELQDSELLDFSVAGFEEEPDWDSGDSLEEKAGKYGVLETGDGLELVWGIGEYGDQSYEVTYTLSNLVRELADGQAMLWNFDTFSSIPAQNLTLEVSGPGPFDEDNARVWGFGFDGDIRLQDGRVVWEAFEEVDSGNDVTVLLQFPPGWFNTQASVDMTLDEQREMAMEGGSYNEEPPTELGPVGIGLISAAAVAVLGGTAGGITYAAKLNKAKKEAGEIRDGAAGIVENDGILYDEIPYKGDDLAGIAYFLQRIHKGYFEDYFSAYLLKWAHEDRIRIETTAENDDYDEEYETIIQIRDYETASQVQSRSFSEFVDDIIVESEDTYGTGLWLMLLDAADKTGFISEDRMQRWAKKHAKEVEEYANYLTEYSEDYLERNGFITFKEVTVWGRTHEIVVPTRAGDELFDRLIQFDNYLEELDLIGFDETTSYLTMEELLLWSVLFYRREEITEQFEDMLADRSYHYPEDQFAYYYWYWYGMTGFRDNWSTGLQSGGFHSHDSSGSFGTAGTGGATSFGGGFGAGGGGGGGAR